MGDGLVFWSANPVKVADLCRGCLIYLATPYTRRVTGPGGTWSRQMNGELARECAHQAGRLVRLGLAVHAPVLQSAMVCEVWDDLARSGAPPAPDPLDAAFWEQVNRPALEACGAVVVPDLPGWADSDGIRDEVYQTLRRNARVFFYAPFTKGYV